MKESIERIITKTDHWPLAERRRYLMLAAACETGARRHLIEQALKRITTAVIRQEIAA